MRCETLYEEFCVKGIVGVCQQAISFVYMLRLRQAVVKQAFDRSSTECDHRRGQKRKVVSTVHTHKSSGKPSTMRQKVQLHDKSQVGSSMTWGRASHHARHSTAQHSAAHGLTCHAGPQHC